MDKNPEDPNNIIATLTGRYTDKERLSALKKLKSLPQEQKDYLVKLLRQTLKSCEIIPSKSWLISALGVVEKKPASSESIALLKRFFIPQENEPKTVTWLHYWSCISLAKICTKEQMLRDLKTAVSTDKETKIDIRTRALCYRLLIAYGERSPYLDKLKEMLHSPSLEFQTEGYRVLGKVDEDAMPPLSDELQTELIDIVCNCLEVNDSRECRVQAANALVSMKAKTARAVEVLIHALGEDSSYIVRRASIDALCEIILPKIREEKASGQKDFFLKLNPELVLQLRKALLEALRDKTEWEIRNRASILIRNLFDHDEIIAIILKEMINEMPLPEEEVNNIIDGIKKIDQNKAVDQITRMLDHPDSEVSQQMMTMLTELGGANAFRAIQARKNNLEKYSELLEQTDSKMMLLFHRLIGQAQMAYYISMTMHVSIFLIGVIALYLSLQMAFGGNSMNDLERIIGVGGAGGSLLVLMLIFYSNPLKNIQLSVTELVKTNVMFLGYMRQLNQVDATFKQQFLAMEGLKPQVTENLVQQIQNSVECTMKLIKTYLNVKQESEQNNQLLNQLVQHDEHAAGNGHKG